MYYGITVQTCDSLMQWAIWGDDMHVITDHDEIHFYEGEEELSIKEGFKRLDALYPYETAEGRHIIDNLKRKFLKA